MPAKATIDTEALYTKYEGMLAQMTLTRVNKELSEKSLREYVAAAWHILEPSNPFVSGWHIDAICDHLQAISDGDLLRLIINLPPRHTKSLVVSGFWPSWEWGPNDHPEIRWLYSSYAEALSIRDSRNTRNIIQSPWYQEQWGDRFMLLGDQNEKKRFDNDKTGFRIATTVRGLGTGEGGDRIVCDDAHNIREVESTAKRVETLLWWDESMSTRTGADPAKTAFVICMQRSHHQDLSGHQLAKDTGYEHLCLPARYEGKNRIFTSLGIPDPRKEVGELLWPGRYPEKEQDKVEKDLNSAYAVGGQMQQDPKPRSGGPFNILDFEVIDSFDRSEIVRSVRYWDKAGTKDGGTHTAGVLMHNTRHDTKDENGNVIESEELFVVEHVERGQWEAPQREKRISLTMKADGKKVTVWVEQEPGSGGKESAQATQRRNPGYHIKREPVTGSKEVRAEPWETAVEAKSVRLVSGPWVKPFLDEHELWPNGATDQIDAAGGGYNKLTGGGTIYFG